MIKKLLVIAGAAMLFLPSLPAQPGKGQQQNNNRAQKTRRNMTELQVNHISSEMHLNEAREERFRTLYAEYLNDLSNLEMRTGRNWNDTVALTNEKADLLIKKEFDFAKKNIQLREKYYSRFREFLSSAEIYKMYRLEREMRMKTNMELQRRMGGKPGGGHANQGSNQGGGQKQVPGQNQGKKQGPGQGQKQGQNQGGSKQ